jgi:alpha-amylase/alpha-mannosidase (GH57 family)
MHQPYYRDMLTGESTMPWVRLHGIHSYYDMLRIYREFPKSRGTINFVPSLVEQLMSYVEGGQSDAFLDHALVPAEALTQQQKVFLLRHFFTANPERKIEPYGPYHKLYYRLGRDRTQIDYAQAVRFFSTQDYLDLQVYHNLVWFGFAAKDEIPELREMLLAGGHFTEDDKKFVVDSQKKILGNLLDEFKAASSSDNVEISTTPYYHPILPLLIDTGIAHRANPKVPLPPVMSAPQLARAQINRALESMEGWTKTRPRGMWPAEGSVCPEMIPMLADAGIGWIATDEDILKKSLAPSQKGLSLYQPFLASHEGADVPIVFRDHGLSDLISFTYSKMPADKAVDDFIGHIRKIEKGSHGKGCLITVVLDGENPWEFYPDSGKEFLGTLFSTLDQEGIRTETIGRAIESSPPTQTIERLHSGSWISANFDIWIGKAQKNQGWDYIKRTLDDTREALQAGDGKSRRAFESLCAACGSDWFWWFDDDFDSAYKGDFDRIFRTHLKNVYTFLERDVPIFLYEPIYRFDEEEASILEPPGCIEPVINGTESSFFEWANASLMTVHGHSSGAMAVSSIDPFETLSFGFNEHTFYVRIDPVDRSDGFKLAETDAINIGIHSKRAHEKFRVRMIEGIASVAKVNEDGSDSPADGVRCAAREVMELAFDFSPLNLSAGDEVTLTIALSKRGIEVRRYSHMHFIVPDEAYEQRMWSV